MALSSISSESIQAFYEESLGLMQYASSSWFSSELLIDLIEGNFENSPMWPKAYEALRKTATFTEALLKEMNFRSEQAISSIETTLKQRSACVYTFTHTKDFIENPPLLKLHLLAQIEKNKPFSVAVLASLLFVAAGGSKYSNTFRNACLNPPSTSEKNAAIQAYRAGVALRKVIDWTHSGADIESESFKNELATKLAHFAGELTLYYHSLELLTKPSHLPLLETQ